MKQAILIILTALLVLPGWATTFNSDGSAQDINAKNALANNGDTITTPVGSFTWTTSVILTKGVQLISLGANDAPEYLAGVTTINNAPLLQSTVPSNKEVIIGPGFDFEGTTNGNALIQVHGGGINVFRITGNTFNVPTAWSVWISNLNDGGGPGPYGVIDNNTVLGHGAFVFVRDNPLSVPNSWHRNMSFGTVKAVYVETNNFAWDNTVFPDSNICMDGDNGARLVFRKNTVNDGMIGNHGADSAGPLGSALQYEAYNNTFTVTSGVSEAFCVFIRGGSGVVTGNTVNPIGSGEINSLLQLTYFRALPDCGGIGCPQDRFYPQDYLGTMQPGMGVVVGATGQDPNFPLEPWVSVPIYSWNNHLNLPVRVGEVSNDGTGFELLNRDYFIGPKPGYSKFTYPHPLTN